MRPTKLLFLLTIAWGIFLPIHAYCQWLEATINVGAGPCALVYNPTNLANRNWQLAIGKKYRD